MRTFNEEWNEYLYNLQTRASRQFREGTSYKLLKEKQEQMENDCRLNFTKDDHAYIEAWIEAVTHTDGEESSYLYAQAFHDCVSLLKALQVIA